MTEPETTPPQPDSAPDAAASQATPDLAAQLAEARAKQAELTDAFLRAKADAENIRRRAEEDMAKARKFAIESFAESLLPVKDSLEAAIAIPDASTDKVLEGVHATLRQLATALERNKVVEINPPPAAKFDPHSHQAISVVPAEQEPNTIVTVLQKGYAISERVLRPALVTVSSAQQA
jgi:molecular chaperone GrpE